MSSTTSTETTFEGFRLRSLIDQNCNTKNATCSCRRTITISDRRTATLAAGKINVRLYGAVVTQDRLQHRQGNSSRDVSATVTHSLRRSGGQAVEIRSTKQAALRLGVYLALVTAMRL